MLISLHKSAPTTPSIRHRILGSSDPASVLAPRYGVSVATRGSVAQIGWQAGFPFPRTDLSHGFRDGYAGRGEAVQDGHSDLELGDLTIKAPRGQSLAEQFDTVHLRFDAASAVIAAPSIAWQAHPKDVADRGRQIVRPKRRDARRASLRAIAPGLSGFQGFAVLRGGMIAAAPRAAPVTVCMQTTRGGSDAGDLLIGRDLVEQFWQHGRVAHVAGRELRRPDFQRLLVNSPFR